MRHTAIAPRTIVRVLLLLAGIIAAPRVVHAQDTSSTANLRPTSDGQVVVLMLRDGSQLVGRVIEVTPTAIRFASALGESMVPRSVVKSVRTSDVSAVHAGELWPEDPSSTRLFFAPTGRTLKQGDVYLADSYILLPSIQFGMTDRITLGGGLSIVPGLGLDEQVYYFTPKVGVYASPELNVSVGALVAGVGRLDIEGSPVGLLYGVSTFGGPDNSVSTGAGFGFAGGTRTTNAILMLGGATRVSRNVALLSENYLFTENSTSALFSGGFRFMGERLSVDFAGVMVSSSSIPFPYLAFLYHF
jgi:hypothetical protein